MEEFLLELLKQGVGIAVAGVALFAVLRLYRDNKEMRSAHEQERREWEQRYITKAETWVEKHHQLVRDMHQLLEALERRLEKRR